jgi:positive regulator of sigma E activity
VLYLVNPFLGIGAFLHTLLDALTTAKDRGIEWLFPFTRLVKHSLYDEEMKRLEVPPDKKVVFYQNDLIADARKSDKDLQETKPAPWRRTYGPALSSALLDQAVGFGSLLLFVYLVILSKLGIHQFVDLSATHIPNNVAIPLAIGIVGIVIELLSGEIDRRRIEAKKERHPIVYRSLFAVSIGLLALAVIVAGILNPAYVQNVVFNELPYIIGGAIVAFVAASFILIVRPRRRIKKEATSEPSII